MTTETIYMAYGSNMNRDAMKVRCPAATYLGAAYFPDHRLVFKGVADMIPAEGFKCAVALWRLTPACEKALDRYEGFCGEDPLRGLYRKEYWTADGKTYMAYVMNRKHVGPPSDGYYKTIEEGFDDANVPTILLKEARDHAFANEMPDPHVSKRWGNFWTELAAKWSSVASSPRPSGKRQVKSRFPAGSPTAGNALRGPLANHPRHGKRKVALRGGFFFMLCTLRQAPWLARCQAPF